jgi:hypothetical protein
MTPTPADQADPLGALLKNLHDTPPGSRSNHLYRWLRVYRNTGLATTVALRLSEYEQLLAFCNGDKSLLAVQARKAALEVDPMLPLKQFSKAVRASLALKARGCHQPNREAQLAEVTLAAMAAEHAAAEDYE